MLNTVFFLYFVGNASNVKTSPYRIPLIPSIVNSTSTASNPTEASTKVKTQQTNGKVPQGTFDIRQKVDSNGVPYFVAELQRGGKRRKSRKHGRSRKHKKSRRHRKSRRN